MDHGAAVSNPANPSQADALGSLIIRNLQPGPAYYWLDDTSQQRTVPFDVLAPGANPPANSTLYTNQPMHAGLNYITMRDGIQLAATVREPYGETCSATSPCPTVIEYSGYNVAGPTDPIPPLIAKFLGKPCTNCGDPNLLRRGRRTILGLCNREPPDAGDRLFRWCFRPLRLSLRLRRVRRY
jgi:hypothetical protein